MLVTGFESPPSLWDQDTTLQLNIDTADYVPGSPEVGGTFMAPVSGRVLVVVGGGARDNSASNRMFIAPRIFIGPQPVAENLVVDVNRNEWVTPGECSHYMYGSRASMITSLVPLRQHYAQLVYRNTGTGGTAEISTREIGVVPLP